MPLIPKNMFGNPEEEILLSLQGASISANSRMIKFTTSLQIGPSPDDLPPDIRSQHFPPDSESYTVPALLFLCNYLKINKFISSMKYY